MTGSDGLRVGYSPYSLALDAPGDRRRFCYYARQREIEFEIADPRRPYDVAVLSSWADVTAWSRYPRPTKIVYDIVDSYLAVPRFGLKQMGRGLVKRFAGQTRHLALDYRKAVIAMCRRADAITCATEEQRAELLELCPNVHVILDYPDELALEPKRDYAPGRPFTLVWEGLPYNLGAFADIAEVIRDLWRTHGIRLRILTNLEFYAYARRFGKRRTDAILGRMFDEFEAQEWDPERMPALVRESDVAIIPIALGDALARGKSENKLVLFWRLGMPTVTSATPAYVRAMHDAGLDLTCESPEAWHATLTKLIEDEDARRRAGETGRAFATETYSPARMLARWDALWASVTS
jgi:glycosyltransferase involved in cell wall biosynthesis